MLRSTVWGECLFDKVVLIHIVSQLVLAWLSAEGQYCRLTSIFVTFLLSQKLVVSIFILSHCVMKITQQIYGPLIEVIILEL